MMLGVLTIILLTSSISSASVPSSSLKFTEDPLGLSKMYLSKEKYYGVIVDLSELRTNIFEWNALDIIYIEELINSIAHKRDRNGMPVSLKIKQQDDIACAHNLKYPQKEFVDCMRKEQDNFTQIKDFILNHVPKIKRSTTGIYVLGRTNTIYNDFCDTMLNYHFAECTMSHNITEFHKGIYRWIAFNSKLKKFSNLEQSGKVETFALLEMNKNSIQLTYGYADAHKSLMKISPKHRSNFIEHMTKDEIVKRDIFDHLILSVEFDDFGGKRARDAYVDMLFNNSGLVDSMRPIHERGFIWTLGERSLTVTDPCLPLGAKEMVEKPLFENLSISVALPSENRGTDGSKFKATIVGSGQYHLCRGNLRRMLKAARKERKNCQFGRPCALDFLDDSFPLPYNDITFIGIGDFYNTTNDMMNLSGKFQRKKFIEKTEDICTTHYEKLLGSFDSKFDSDQIKMECFKATWIETFLTDGIRMPVDYSKFETLDKINGDSFDWTLGTMVEKALEIRSKILKLKFDKNDTNITNEMI